jgi:hypothetical protein
MSKEVPGPPELRGDTPFLNASYETPHTLSSQAMLHTFRKLSLLILIIFSVLHLIRDLLQIGHVDTWLTTSLHTATAYCTPYCDYITLPFEISIIIIGSLVLKRKHVSLFEVSLYLIFAGWMIIFLLSYLYH